MERDAELQGKTPKTNSIRKRILKHRHGDMDANADAPKNQLDPQEDTETCLSWGMAACRATPKTNSIRKRILKRALAFLTDLGANPQKPTRSARGY